MKKFNIKIFLVLFVICIQLSVINSQNLVPNPSFEDTVACPNFTNEVSKAIGWNNNSNGTPDYFHVCSQYSVSVPNNVLGYQYPMDSNAYCGLYTYTWVSLNQREYIGRQISSPLIIGQKYYCSFCVSLASIDSSTSTSCNCASNNLGLLFTTTPYNYDIWNPTSIRNFAHINSNSIISDTLNWTTISGSFIADSSYQYFTIGN
ncbi:MAG: hypothetical protein ABIJ16_03840, partial [Bacteroidota bacterium]